MLGAEWHATIICLVFVGPSFRERCRKDIRVQRVTCNVHQQHAVLPFTTQQLSEPPYWYGKPPHL